MDAALALEAIPLAAVRAPLFFIPSPKYLATLSSERDLSLCARVAREMLSVQLLSFGTQLNAALDVAIEQVVVAHKRALARAEFL